MKRLLPIAISTSIALLLTGCLKTESEIGQSQYSDIDMNTGSKITSSDERSTTRVQFDPENQVIPFPNNLMFEAGWEPEFDDYGNYPAHDGTLKVPLPKKANGEVDTKDSSYNVAKALSDLDGFSTVESWRLAFTGPINKNTLIVGQTVRVFEMAQVEGKPVLDDEGKETGEREFVGYPARIRPKAVERELTADDIQLNYEESDIGGKKSYVMYIVPKKPLKHDRTYTVAVVKGIEDLEGKWVDAPLAASVANGTTKLGLTDLGEPTTCEGHKADQITMLQCITYYGIRPVLKGNYVAKDDLVINWSITTQREDAPLIKLAEDIIAGKVQPEFPSSWGNVNGQTMKCQKALCFLDVGTMKDRPTSLTPGGKAVVFPGTIRLPVMTKGQKQTLDEIYNNNFYLGSNNGLMTRARAERITSGTWSCGEKGLGKEIKSCNTDAVRNKGDSPKIEGWVYNPVVLAMPKMKLSDNGGKKFPLVIFQHAIQQDRSNALAFADALAEKGFAVIGIDMPMHGMVYHRLDMTNPKDSSRSALYAHDINKNFQDTCVIGICPARAFMPYALERTYLMDLVSDMEEVDDEGITKSDGNIDASGAHFLNPAVPLAQRDILRQSTIDLAFLSYYLRKGMYSQCGMKSSIAVACDDVRNRQNTDDNEDVASKTEKYLKDAIDFNNIHFVGHSVGNIVAAPWLSMDKNIRSITMLAPAGVLLRTLEGSEVIGAKLADGLNAKGVLKGTENYYRFFASVHAAIDGAEPLNYYEGLKTRTPVNGDGADDNGLAPRPILITQIVGDETNSQDKVLPPVLAYDDYPMAGSNALANFLGLATSGDYVQRGREGDTGLIQNDDETVLQLAMKLNRGDHASFLLPKNEVHAKAVKEARELDEMYDEQIEFLESIVASAQAERDALDPSKKYYALEYELATDKIKARQARLDVALAKKANHIIPDADNQDETFVGVDIHPEMQRQVASFLSNQGKAITDVDLEKVR